MKLPKLLCPLALLVVVAASLPAAAQQSSASVFRGRPLYSAPAATGAAQAQPAATDSRIVELAERLKATAGQVQNPNPAAVPASRVPASRAQLQQRASGPVAIRMRHSTGTPRFIEAPRLESAAAAASGTQTGGDISTARNFLDANKDLLRLNDPDRELVLEEHKRDESERRHLRFTQHHRNIPVWPAEVGVHLDEGGHVYLMTGAYVATPEVASTQAKIAANDAVARARVQIAPGAIGENTEPELIIYAPGEQTPRLAWKFHLHTALDEDWLVVVDAENGRTLTSFNQVCRANVVGSGTDMLGQVRQLNVWEQNGTFTLTDTSKPMFDPTSQPPSASTTRGGIIIVDARNQPPSGNLNEVQQVFPVTASSANGFDLPDAVSAAFNVSLSYDYFQQVFNRRSFDDKGKSILVIVRLGQNLKNAFFSPDLATMGLGNGDLYPAALDVVGHEITHGVVGTSAGLIYQFQSGALNEAYADIFGEMIEHRNAGSNDWILGTQLREPFRDMANPGSKGTPFGRPYPSKMTEFFNLSGDTDAGGVHFNSSIINRCFYLLTEGLEGGIGRVDASRIFYRALTVYLMQNSQFIDARLACVRAAKDLFGDNSVQVQRTAAAFDAVEIFDSQPTPPPNDFPEVQAPDSTLFLYGNPSNGFLLARREGALSDPQQGRFLGNNFASARPPAVTGSGDIAVYVTADNDIALLRTDGQAEQKLGFPGQVHSVGMSPDGNQFGFVLRDANGRPDNKISVINLAANSTATFELLAPAPDTGTISTIVNADAMTFTASGRFLIYDALNSISLANGSRVEAFSIYALDLTTGNILSLVPPIEGFNIGNPSISKTNDGFMIFEAIDLTNAVSIILTINLTNGNVTEVARSLTFAYPCFTGDDDAFVFADVNPNTVTGTSLYRRPLAADRQTTAGNAVLWIADGGYPFVYRRGNFQGPPPPTPNRLANIATRGTVGAGDDVLIGGFIVQGNGPKRVLMRAIGPSLPVGNALGDPTLELFSGGQQVAANDNWESNQRQEIVDTTIPPSNGKESAIIVSLNPGAYTVVMRGAGGATGVGLVEVYDLDGNANTKLVNIATRGSIGTGENVMIGGFIVQGQQPRRVIVRGIGPSLPVGNALQNTQLQLFSGQNLLGENDDWRTGGQEQEIIATSIPPNDNRESAIVATLVPGPYTVVVQGAGGTTGVGLVEVYELP